MKPIMGLCTLLLSCASIYALIIYTSKQDLVVINNYPSTTEKQDAHLNYEETKEKLSRIIKQDNLHIETKKEIESLLISLEEIMVGNEADVPPGDNGEATGGMPDDKTEAYLKKEYALLGLSYEESKARVKSILNAEMTDPELIELSNKISKGAAK